MYEIMKDEAEGGLLIVVVVEIILSTGKILATSKTIVF
jgi:hypothetical protein